MRSSIMVCQLSGVAFEESISGSSSVNVNRLLSICASSNRRNSQPLVSAPGTRPFGESIMPMVPPVYVM